MSECTPEFWTLKEIKESLEKEWNGRKKIVIPMFQRGKRWDKGRKETFIDSLRKRYPIGTLLFYKTVDGTQEIYTLIDGLQRGSAIKDYLSSPTKYFRIDEIDEENMKKIYSLIISNGSEKSQKEKINEIICNYIHNLKTYEDLEIYELYKILEREFPILKSNTSNISIIGDALKENFKNFKSDYNKLSSMPIPAIIYTGEENTLPEIFERINSKGVALTEYEIYAASWPRQEFIINNDNIIEYILKKYDMLNDTEYSISGYDREEKRINRNVNAFEYVFGLSKYLQNTYSSLKFHTNLSDDETNPVAFQLLNACFNNSHKQIKNVYDIILRFSSNMDILEKKLLYCIEFVEKCIQPILKFKGNKRNTNDRIFHSQYQIMSLISYVFRKKYDIESDELKENDNWRENKQLLLKNIWKYYVYDLLVKYWGEGGTGKIHSANNEDRYLLELTKGQFSAAFDSYSEELFSRHEKTQVSNPCPLDYVILNTIYLNEFSALDQLSIEKFDVEHIATKKQMKSLNAKCNGEGLPISHIANLCYLPEFENRSKGEKNFYQDNKYLAESNLTLEEIENKYSFTSRNDLSFMDSIYNENDFERLKEAYIVYLKKRNQIIRRKFLTALGYSDDN